MISGLTNKPIVFVLNWFKLSNNFSKHKLEIRNIDSIRYLTMVITSLILEIENDKCYTQKTNIKQIIEINIVICSIVVVATHQHRIYTI